MDAGDGVAAAQISSEMQEAGFLRAARAPIAETAFRIAKGDLSKLLAPMNDMDAQSRCSKSLVSGEEQLASSRRSCTTDESLGGWKFLAGDGVSASQNAASEMSHESRRILLSCSMSSSRAKKKRRSRASNKAPIQVFSTDTSNFMAMVHKLTGIPSNAPPFLSSLPSLWTPSPKILPLNQGLPTLDTSMLLLPAFSCDRALSDSGYSGMQAGMQSLPMQQHLSSINSSLKTTGQGGQLPPNMDCIPTSYSDLVRSMTSSLTSSSLPRLWDAAYTSQKTAAHQLPQNAFSGKEVLLSQTKSYQGISRELNCPTSSTMSGLEMLLAGQDKLGSTGVSAPIGCIAKEELL